MAKLKIVLPTPEELLREKLDALRHPSIKALKGKNLWPIEWQSNPDWTAGMRGVPHKKSKKQYDIKYRENRRKRNRIAAQSRSRNRE